MSCKYACGDICTHPSVHQFVGTCAEAAGIECDYSEEVQKKPAATPDYNQLVANLLTKRDELKSALRETEAELEEIEDFLDALDRFYDQAQDQFKFTKTIPHNEAWAYGCKFCHPCADGVECDNPKMSNYMCDLFYGDNKTSCGGWEAKKND